MITTPAEPGAERFCEALAHVQRYVGGEPAAHADLVTAVRADPESVTLALLALGAVLLDLAAGAFRLTPDEVLDKVSAQVVAGAGVPAL